MKKIIATILAAGSLGAGGTFAADRAVDPYVDEGTHYKLEIKSDIPQGERVEISKTEATMTLKGWNDEYAITIKPQIPTTALGATDRDFKVDADRKLLSKKMEYRTGDVTAFIEPKANSENEFDIDFTLHSKPETNVFTYKIEGAEDFDFFYQSAEWCHSEGNICLEKVIGSYAVYHKTKANHIEGSTNYATGKAFHIYRPKAIDANGAEVWAELNYDNGMLNVTVPQKFLGDAAYPVTVDPTIGYTTTGATEFETVTGDVFYLSNVSTTTIGFDVSIASVAFYGRKEGTDMGSVAAMYQFGVSSTTADLLTPQSSELTINSTTAQWWVNTFSGPTISAGAGALPAAFLDYTDTNNNIHIYRDGAVSGDTKFQANAYPTWANPATLTNSANRYSIYANYSRASTGGEHVQVDTFLSSGNWVAPVGVSSTTVEAWGGGGGSTAGVGSGGGGAYARSSGISVTAGNAYVVSVGTGGGAGAIGATSTFNGTTVVAQGGRAAGGVGGSAAASTGDVKYSGGSGLASTTLAAGGGAAGDSGDGTSVTTQTFRLRGGPNNGGYGSQGPTDVAGVPGGGGGVSASATVAGARGEVRITYSTLAPANAASVASRSWGFSTTSLSTHPMSMPNGITAGDLLIAVITNDGNATSGIDGWTQMGTGLSGTAIRSTVFYKTATGGDTATATTSASEGIAYHVYRIRNGGTPTGTSANGTSANPNPPSHNTGSSATYLWIATAGQDQGFVGTYIFAGCPTGYTSCLYQPGYGAGGSVHGAASDVFKTAQTEDPGTFTMPTPSTDRWVAWTIAVPYSAPAGGDPASSPAHFYIKNVDFRFKNSDLRVKR